MESKAMKRRGFPVIGKYPRKEEKKAAPVESTGRIPRHRYDASRLPSALQCDPVLLTEDRRVWSALRYMEKEWREFPHHAQIAAYAGVRDVECSLSVLRATGWMAMLNPLQLGNDAHPEVYQMQELLSRFVHCGFILGESEPLQMSEVYAVDDEFIRWLGDTAEGKHCQHPRAIMLAQCVLKDISERVNAGEDMEKIDSPYILRLKSNLVLESDMEGFAEGRWYNITGRTVRRMDALMGTTWQTRP